MLLFLLLATGGTAVDLDGVYGGRFLAFGVYVMKISGNVLTANFVEMGEDNPCYGVVFSLDETTKQLVFAPESGWQEFLNQLTLLPKQEEVTLTYVETKKGVYSFLLKIKDYDPIPMTTTWTGTRQNDLHMPRKLEEES